jgi:thiamine biosynthesis lipoprotein
MTTGSLATSGNSERGIVVLGQHLGHLLDPSTGRPAPDFGSLTVLAPTGLAADALSTGLYAMGPLKALEWCSHREGIEVLALVVSSNGLQALASSGLKGRIQPCDSELQVEFPVFSTSVR